ncbi:MAG: repair protein RecO [Candidatus Saccharibacteria bacterium]|nr:repair protein RecO [Candidatus Saccharibacteria bacterium]
MKQVTTQAIVLTRTDFGEADRIITFLTPDKGKVRVIAKAVRKSKSKLAGGIELFSTSDISYVVGRGDISTLTSSRLITYYGNIVKDLERTGAGYEFIRLLHKATEEQTEPAYFHLLEKSFKALNDSDIDLELVVLWFNMQLLKLAGHTPNLRDDTAGARLQVKKTYDFNLDEMGFVSPREREGQFQADHIKFMRLGFSAASPHLLQRVTDAPALAVPIQPLVKAMLAHVRA